MHEFSLPVVPPQGSKKHGHGHGHGHKAPDSAAAESEESAGLLSSGDEEHGDIADASAGDRQTDSGIALTILPTRKAVEAQAAAGTALPLLVLDDTEEAGGGAGNYSFLPEPEVK